jgi:hypothetical protein
MKNFHYTQVMMSRLLLEMMPENMDLNLEGAR